MKGDTTNSASTKETPLPPPATSTGSTSRARVQRTRVQSYKVDSEESGDEKVVVQTLGAKRTAKTVTSIVAPANKRVKVTAISADPLTSETTTTQDIKTGESEFIDLPIETINPKSEPEYSEDGGEIETVEQDDSANYGDEEGYSDMKYDDSYYTENEDTKAGVSGFNESYGDGDQSATEAQG